MPTMFIMYQDYYRWRWYWLWYGEKEYHSSRVISLLL